MSNSSPKKPATSASANGSAQAKSSSTSGTKPASTTRPTGNGARAISTPAKKSPAPAAEETGDMPEAQPVKARNAAATRVQAQRACALSRAQQRRKEEQRKVLLRRWGPIGVTLGVALVAILLFVWLSNPGPAPNGIGQVVPADVFKNITTVPTSVYDTVKTGGVTNPLQIVSGTQPVLRDSAGKPRFVYVGAEYCPYCAAERWSIITALSRFGTFSDLHLTASSSTDAYPNTSTFTFVNSTYTSKYVTFEAVETTDRNQNQLQTLNASQQQLFTAYDGPPYSSSPNGIPFIDIANQYVEISSAYIPANLTGMTWLQISQLLTNPQSAITQEIIGGANYLTAAICASTGNVPANICTAGAIPAIEQQIAKGA